MDEALVELGEYLSDKLGDHLLDWEVAYHELTIQVERETIGATLRFLRDDAQCLFACFIDLAGADYPERPNRFDIVYHLLSPRQNARIRVKIETNESTLVPSVIDVFPAANWFEREAYDLYGVLFSNHPDLRRILTDYGFQGHPMRKDFPLTGFVEVRYDDERKRVVYEPVKLTQEFRNFDFVSPWEAPDYPLPGDEKAEDGTNGKVE